MIYPVLTVILSTTLLRERASRRATFGIALSMPAILMLSWQSTSSGGASAMAPAGTARVCRAGPAACRARDVPRHSVDQPGSVHGQPGRNALPLSRRSRIRSGDPTAVFAIELRSGRSGFGGLSCVGHIRVEFGHFQHLVERQFGGFFGEHGCAHAAQGDGCNRRNCPARAEK